MPTPDMRADWNERAREDAHYYVAFGRRGQSNEEFFATASDVLRDLDRELKRGVPGKGRERRFLEIGCGPGRLLKPMSERCGEIHGVDVSDEMVARARENLAGIRHAHVHVGTGSTLDPFADASFDFIYSYAVFQHIPDREVVFSYLRETHRLLKPGGLARLQLNGLPPTAKPYTTWEGVRISGDEVRAFTRNRGLQLLALEGEGTQYLWTTWRKTRPDVPGSGVRIRRVTNSLSSEPAAPARGRFAAVSVWVDGLSERTDLNTIDVRIAGQPATVTYLSAPERDGLQQVSARLPGGLSTGVAPVELGGATAKLRILPAPPIVPRVLSLTDGVDLLSGPRIRSGLLKLTLEEVEQPEQLSVRIGGREAASVEVFRIDPGPPRDEMNITLPRDTSEGEQVVEVYFGLKLLWHTTITVS